MHAERGGPVEFERSICFEKMIVAADLDRPVSCILDAHGNLPPPGVNFDVAAHWQDFARPDPVGGLGKPSRPDRIVDRHEFGAIGKCSFHLDHRHQIGDALHDVIGAEQRRAE